MSSSVTETDVQAWHTFMRVHALLTREISRELERSHGLSISMYDVLVALDNAPQSRLRMGGLVERIMLTPGGLTRVVESLRKLGYVRRRVDPKDRRSVIVTLTPEGREARLTARTTALQGAADHFLRHLTAEESATLLSVFRRVLDRERPAGRNERTDEPRAAVVATSRRSREPITPAR